MNPITHRIAAAIRANDLPAYQRERYLAIPDGEIVRFTSEDFSNVDFRGVKAIIEAEGCDFRGMKYDEETQFVYGSGELAARSRFVNCQLDDEARGFLMRQGVEIISYDKYVKL